MAKRKRSRKSTKRRGRRRGRRRGLKGLKGLGGTTMRSLLPPVVGTTLTLGTTLGIRAYLQPNPGTTAATIYKWAPAIGGGAGALGALALYFLSGSKAQGRDAAMTTALVSLISGAAVLGLERLNAGKVGAVAALGYGGGAVPSGDGTAGRRGMGMVVPEQPGFGAIVMERLNGGQSGLGMNYQQQGQNIRLQGTVETDAFGSRTYG